MSPPTMTLRDVAARIASRELSPVEVVEKQLRRIEELDAGLNAFISVDGERALEAAAASAAALGAGYNLGPLHGVPLALKDNISERGAEVTAGSKILRGSRSTQDATVAERLRRAGAIFVGRLNMHEFAYGVTTDNPHYGATRNPWDGDRSPGGSSGGSGAAVAARLCYGALGTDTGCSVRLPASFNGVTGLRPTIGRVSNHGVVPLAWTLDTVGPLCRTAEDCAVMFEVLAGHDRRDPQTFNVPVPDYVEELERGIDGLRIGIISGFSLSGLQPEVEAATRAAIEVLEGASGRPATEIELDDLEHCTSALLTVDIAEPAAYHAEWLRTRPEEYGEDVRALLEVGEMYLATHYIQAQRFRTVIRDALETAFRHVDVILTPTVPFTAPPIGATEVELPTGEQLDVISAVMRYNAIPPLAGMPAISVPCGFAGDGLPIGMQLIGRPFDESTLFRAGHAYQSETDWHERVPQGASAG